MTEQENYMTSAVIVQKLCNYCLAGNAQACNQKNPAPEKYSWSALLKRDGDDLFDYYRHILEDAAMKNLHGASPDSYLQTFFGRYHTDGIIGTHVW
jgi:hypothetical protein